MSSAGASTGGSILPHLKFRTVQPVDIQRCYQLEQDSYPPDDQASKSTLQHRQHHAAPFFRCALLKKQSEVVENDTLNALFNGSRENIELELDRQSSNDEACHHVHHSNYNHLIGYICGTRCHDFAPAMELKTFTSSPQDRTKTQSNDRSSTMYPYPMKHEPSGPYLAIHSLVVQPEYRHLGVARSLLENYIKSIDTFNASADSAKPTITHRGSVIKEKVQKRPSKIEKLILVTKSHLLDFFISLGFRWRATISIGKTSVYELEREVKSITATIPPTPPMASSALKSGLTCIHEQSNNLTGEDCYLVDAFANPKKCGSGNSAAIVVLDGPPSRLIAERQSNGNDEDNGQWGMMNEQLSEFLSNVAMDEEDEEELSEMRAEVWMHFVAREFHQPATAFVWPISKVEENAEADLLDDASNRSTSEIFINQQHQFIQRLSVLSDCSDDVTELSSNEDGTDQNKTHELHHYIRFYTRSGIEVDMCAHATLSAASVLFRRYANEQHQSSSQLLSRNKELVLVFHSRKDIILRATRAPSSTTDESIPRPISTPKKSSYRTVLKDSTKSSQITKLPNIIRISMDYPWRTVDPVPVGKDCDVAVIAMLRRAFFGAWSVVSPDDDDNDNDTDELAFSLSVSHVLFMGVTKGGEDLLIELTVEGFELLCGRSVDYVALKQGWSGYSRGVIVCCEVPEVTAGGNSTVASDESKQDTQTIRPASVAHSRSEMVNLPDEPLDFRSRYFEPKVGVNEDPVSGWPHCLLAPYFGKRRGKQRLIGMQESDRTGLVECILKEEEQKVCIIGSTVTTVSGKLQMQA